MRVKICAKLIRNLYPFVKYQLSLMMNTTSLCCGFCMEEKLEMKTVCNVFLNKIEIFWNINKGLNLLFQKNQPKSLLSKRIFDFQLTMSKTSLFYCSNLCFSWMPGLFVLPSIRGFSLRLQLFMDFSLIIRAENVFFMIVFMWKSSKKAFFC